MRIFKGIRHLTKMQLVLLIAIVGAVSSVLVLLVNPSARKGPMGFGPPASMTMFQMADGGFSILYPQNWVTFETTQGSHGDHEIVAIILVSGRQIANVTVARQSFSDGDINSVVDWGKLRAARLTDYKFISLTPLADKSSGGFIHEYSWDQYSLFNNKTTSFCQDVYILKINTGYSISFCSDEKDWSSLESIFVEMRQSISIR